MCDHCGWIIGFSATLGLFFCQSFHEQSFPIGFYDTYVNHGSPLLMIVFLIIIPNTLGRIIPELIINHRGELNTAQVSLECSKFSSSAVLKYHETWNSTEFHQRGGEKR